ncbi:LacI family transcriptional regulator, partial [Xanthomonas perforans]
DNTPRPRGLWPPLPSVRRHTRDTGRTAAAMLIQPDNAPQLPTASVRPHLIVRDSCQPPED